MNVIQAFGFTFGTFFAAAGFILLGIKEELRRPALLLLSALVLYFLSALVYLEQIASAVTAGCGG